MSNPEKNYFLVNRNLLSSDRWLNEPFTRGQAWVDLFGLAQHSDSYIRVRGIRVDVKRGQLAYSQLTLAKRWRWSRNKVRRYLKELEKHGDLKQQNNEVTTLITIVKYDLWQGAKQQTEQQKDNRRTTNGTHKKNVNNVKNVNTTTTAEQVLEILELSSSKMDFVNHAISAHPEKNYVAVALKLQTKHPKLPEDSKCVAFVNWLGSEKKQGADGPSTEKELIQQQLKKYKPIPNYQE